jgi:hypothetical protein
MAVLYLTEFADVGIHLLGEVPVAFYPETANQTVSITGGSLQSAAFNANTRFIRVHPDVVCSIAIGANPTATTVTARMSAGTTEYFAVRDGHKIAVISNT